MLAMVKTLKMRSEPLHITTDLTFRRMCQIHKNAAASTAQSDKQRSDYYTSWCPASITRCTQGLAQQGKWHHVIHGG